MSKLDNIGAGTCPNCESEDVENVGVNYLKDHNEGVSYLRRCNDCGAKFREVYQLEYLGSELVSVPKTHNGRKNQ